MNVEDAIKDLWPRTMSAWCGKHWHMSLEQAEACKPSRRRLTQAEFDAELRRAAGTDPNHPVVLRASKAQIQAITRTGRRRSWWQRGVEAVSERVANRDPALWSVQERAARQANSWRAKGAQEAGRWVNGKAWVENR